MNSGERIWAQHGGVVHLLVVLRRLVGEAPGQQDQLTVAVDGVVEDELVLARQHIVPDVHVLNLGEGLGTVVGVGALVVGGTALIEVESPVPVGINSLQKNQVKEKNQVK